MPPLAPQHERRLLWLLALTQFTIIMDFMVMMPLGPQIMHTFGIGPAAFAAAVSAYSWCSGASGLLAATYIDRFDRRRLLLTVYALFSLSNLACALAGTFPLLLAARAFAGLSGGVLGAVILAIVSDVVPPARRGAATGVIMSSFALAAVAGVPIGIALGAHLGWAAPFFLLTALTALFWLGARQTVPPLTAHLREDGHSLGQILGGLWQLLTHPHHLRAFVLTFVMMSSHMMVIPFISPVLVANHGIAPQDLSWLYVAGGAATFFTSRAVGRLADRYGRRRVFVAAALLSFIPVLVMTHLPAWPFIGMLLFFPCFMVILSSRMVPMQALMTTVPAPQVRGAFLSANNAVMSIGTGCGAWLGGLLLSTGAGGQIGGYGFNGWVAVVASLFCVLWIRGIKGSDAHGDPSMPHQACAPGETERT
ncbi:MFS transporter [Ralstonia pseudosolanacearum]|uniref:Probable tranporter transmembrane protein n=1 Tax=Ralstonia nicotianae (strain ATCC BAA-1114 / GMI1000) TaxID=267608 RepID=Q8XTZ5_RALN1|nr:MFS transporter [Ralstonia pseudosolanacearum]AST28867.1 MFS transporter [Ralstonia pseudosolanacearum]MDC6283549.1 MFS transporter [Ralstonia pseudosolanacearum]CAD16897.1 probable tranporter transmembrane protein [Ralstonia pseudosolanacearum GMI1000]